MKNILKISILLFILLNNNCIAQQIVQTTKDIYKLKENEQMFINKPLKNLLKEIKPKIKMGYASNEEGSQYFAFRFRTLEQQKKSEGSWEDRVSLYVYVKNPIDWHFEKRPKGQELVWTNEDTQKYRNLVVVRIKVIIPPRDRE